jgi:diguanylate cyclase (GGDEF)-like protein/PAS domain S-box-containing protein
MPDDPRLYRFVSNLLAFIDPATPPERLHEAIYQGFCQALPPHAVDALVFSLHEPVLNRVNFAFFRAIDNHPCPADRPLSATGGLSDWVILNRKSRLWIAGDPADDLPRPRNPAQARYGVPMLADGHAFGAMLVESFTPGFRYDQKTLDFIDQAMHELSRLYRLYERLRTGHFVINNPSVPFLVFRVQDARIIEANKAAEALGYAPGEILGKPFLEFFAEAEREDVRRQYDACNRGTAADPHFFSHLLHRRGVEIPVEVIVATGDYYNGRPALIVTCVDVSEVQRIQKEVNENKARLLRLDREDALTGLLNQPVFLEEAQKLLSQQANSNAFGLSAIVVLDLDNFKAINWFQGIEAGDRLLRLVADRIRSGIRPYDLIARFDSNCFGLLLGNLGALESVGPNVQRLLSRIALPFELGEATVNTVNITASAGVSVFPQHGANIEELIKNAEAALMVAKKQRNKFALVSESIIQEFMLGMSYQEDLRQALQHGEFVAWYQPKFDRQGRVVGCEALARWQSASRGLVLPGRFVSTLERIGLIGELGRQIFEQACALAQRIHEAGMSPFSVAINASPRELDEIAFLEQTTNTVERFGFVPGTVEFEITESVIMASENFNLAVLDVLAKLQTVGLRISIDDFGTGNSSLTRLRTLARYVDKIKIDKSLVDQIGSEDGGDAYFAAILNLARSLETADKKITFVIEGVETKAQADFLLGSQFADIELEFQGYYFAKPMPADQLLQLLARQTAKVL